MANLKDIKLKIKSVKNTEKTTKAMKLVSNVKLKKAKDAAVQSSAYAIKINEVLSEIAAKISDNISDVQNSKIFDTKKEPKIVDIIFVTADKGLCGMAAEPFYNAQINDSIYSAFAGIAGDPEKWNKRNLWISDLPEKSE